MKAMRFLRHFAAIISLLVFFSGCTTPGPELPTAEPTLPATSVPTSITTTLPPATQTEPEPVPPEPEPAQSEPDLPAEPTVILTEQIPWFDVSPYTGVLSPDCQPPVTSLTTGTLPSHSFSVDIENAVGNIDSNIWDGYILESYSFVFNDSNLPFWELIRQMGIFQYARADCIFDSGVIQAFTGNLKQLVETGKPVVGLTGQPVPPLSLYQSGALYAEDEQGNPEYNFWFMDAMLDIFVSHGLKPVLQLEYMPEGLVDENDKVRNFQGGLINGPNDHDKFRELMYQTARHCIERYGVEEVRTWYFTLREEPDLRMFFIDGREVMTEGIYYLLGDCPPVENPIPSGSMDNYLRMYDYFADGIKRADEQLKVGGPNIAFHDWFRPFIEHCVNGTNFATGRKGAPLDAIFWHSYGPIDFHAKNARKKLNIINQYPSLAGIPTIIDEWGQVLNKMVDGNYTNYEGGRTLYTNYDAAYLSRFIDGVLNEPENYPNRVMRWGVTNNVAVRYLSIMFGNYFIPMPVLNTYILLGKIGDQRVEFSGGKCGDPVHGFAARTENGVQVLLYNFNETDEQCESAPQDICLTIQGIPQEWQEMKHYQIDNKTSNAWANLEVNTAITPGKYSDIQEDAQLKIVEYTDRLETINGQISFYFSMPSNSVSLVAIGEEALPSQMVKTPHIERLIEEEAAYITAFKSHIASTYKQLVDESFSSGGQPTTNPYSIWGKKALWSLYTIEKAKGDSAALDEIRVRLLSTTALNDVERFTLLNERVRYLEAIGNSEDEILSLQGELEPLKKKLEILANWTRWTEW